MEITRNILNNDMTINLTSEELERAAMEYLYRTARVEVVRQIEDMEEYKNVPDDLIDVITTEFREKMDGDLRDEMILAAIHQHDEELEEYKQKWKVFSVKVTQTKERWFTVRAKDESDADTLLEEFLNDSWDKAAEYFEDEDGEYDSYYLEEDRCTDPDDAEIKSEEE